MKTVMLVDDERPARELIKLLIDWNRAGFKILWEARNGRQALEQYAQEAPDLIITDVQMPVMDGLELLKRIKEQNPAQRIVILSCHENFSYAQKALKYGVMDYLIKDALTDEMLYGLLEQILQEDAPDQEEPAKDWASPEILTAFFSRHGDGPAQASRLLSPLLEKDRDYFCCACKPEGFSGLQSEWTLLIEELFCLLNEQEGGDVFLCRQQCLMVLCLTEHHTSKMNAFNSRFQILRRIRGKLSQLTGCSISMGISSQSSASGQLSQLTEEAFSALESKVFLGTGKTLYYNPQYNRSQRFQIDTLNNQLQNIRNAVEGLDEAVVQKELSHIYSKGLSGIVHYHYLSYVNAILIDMLMDACRKRKIPYDLIFGSEMLDLDVFDRMDTADHMHQWFVDCFFRLFRASVTGNPSYSPRIRKILDYIHENFQQDISLETVADTFWIHKVYLAKIFKQETGKSVNEYIRSFRLDKAKELLLRENIKISEVVTATGFNNPQSFYTLFKKYVGMKPGEYRDQTLKHPESSV